MTEKEIIEVISRWKDNANADKFHAIHDEKYGAANYFMGKEQALKDVLDLITTSTKINTPWEE